MVVRGCGVLCPMRTRELRAIARSCFSLSPSSHLVRDMFFPGVIAFALLLDCMRAIAHTFRARSSHNERASDAHQHRHALPLPICAPHNASRRTNEAALQVVGSHLEQLQRAHPAGLAVNGARFSPAPELPLYVRVEPGAAADVQPVRASLVLPAVPCWDLSIRCAYKLQLQHTISFHGTLRETQTPLTVHASPFLNHPCLMHASTRRSTATIVGFLRFFPQPHGCIDSQPSLNRG